MVHSLRALPYLLPVIQLGKPRITLMVTLIALLGGMLAAGRPFDNIGLAAGIQSWLLPLLAGTAMLSWGINALNQYLEKEVDALMKRTESRPLPAGVISPLAAFWTGTVTMLLGLGLLASLNWLTLGLGIGVAVFYLAIYTPLKRLSTLNMLAGAVPGSMPPLVGWAAVRGSLDAPVLWLFAWMFLWQYAHFLPIARLYRHDYRRAGLKMLSVNDERGIQIRWQLPLYVAATTLVSLHPELTQLGRQAYVYVAVIFGAAFFLMAMATAFKLQDRTTLWTLRMSVIYLPVVLGALVWGALF